MLLVLQVIENIKKRGYYSFDDLKEKNTLESYGTQHHFTESFRVDFRYLVRNSISPINPGTFEDGFYYDTREISSAEFFGATNPFGGAGPMGGSSMASSPTTGGATQGASSGGNTGTGYHSMSSYATSDPLNLFNFQNGTEQQKSDVLDAAYNIIGESWFTEETVDIVFLDGKALAGMYNDLTGSSSKYLTGLFVGAKNNDDGKNKIYLSNQLWDPESDKNFYYTSVSLDDEQYNVWDALAHEYAHYMTVSLQQAGNYAFNENLSTQRVNALRTSRGKPQKVLFRESWYQFWRLRP